MCGMLKELRWAFRKSREIRQMASMIVFDPWGEPEITVCDAPSCRLPTSTERLRTLHQGLCPGCGLILYVVPSLNG